MRISDWSSDVCSSDLVARHCPGVSSVFRLRRLAASGAVAATAAHTLRRLAGGHYGSGRDWQPGRASGRGGGLPDGRLVRSEEHTSELQSLMRTSYAVFCLKKKNNNSQQATAASPQIHHN